MKKIIAAVGLVLVSFASGLLGAYATKVYIEDGGSKMVVADGGEVEFQSGSTLDIQNGTELCSDTLAVTSIEADEGEIATLTATTGEIATLTGTDATITTVTATTVNADLAQFAAASAPPVACGAGTEGAIYVDSDIHKACICNATAYVLMNDDSTTTGCS